MMIQGNVTAIGDRVLVTDMYFGEQTTSGGIIIANDDGKTRGIYPRWAKVYDKGPENKDEYNVGDWILIEHGRWTRAMKVQSNGDDAIEIRMVDAANILATSDKRPEGAVIGAEYADGEHATVNPQDFVRP
jgi:co-chaperonin GroES (HSP10)